MERKAIWVGHVKRRVTDLDAQSSLNWLLTAEGRKIPWWSNVKELGGEFSVILKQIFDASDDRTKIRNRFASLAVRGAPGS